jgi:hypothetical protein
MKRDYLYIDDREGNAVAGAEVYIKTGAGDLVTIYSDNGTTTQTNPMSTDNDGECNFFAADGTYTIEVYVEGVLQQTVLGHQHYDESGQLEAANNLSDVESVSTARTNLGLGDLATADAVTESFVIACSGETTALTAGTALVTFRMPYAFTVTAVRASLTGAATDGTITVDINESGTTILSTKLTIDATEKTSTTAATPAVISDASIASDAEITIDLDDNADGTATGLKVTLIGHQ